MSGRQASSEKHAFADWFNPANDFFKLWTDQQKNMFAAWAEGTGVAPLGASPGTQADSTGSSPPQMSDLMKRSMEAWATLAQRGWPEGAMGDVDAASVRKLFDPNEWQRAGLARFDIALERLTEGPGLLHLGELDRKFANARKLWLERARNIEGCRAIIQAAWTRAFERFMKSLNDASAPPLKTGRAVLELWLDTANTSLLEMHRSEEFLEAQRRATRSATEYQLQEREIAEAFCAMHHIPTRTEVDELQRGMWEMKRELRALRGAGKAGDASAPSSKRKPQAPKVRARKGARR